MLNQERLKSVLNYNPETGVFTWIVKKSLRSSVGSTAGTVRVDGYVTISVDGKRYLAHRLAFLYMTGKFPVEVDHADMNRTNNRWSNLRSCTHVQNFANSPARRSNVLGVKGVSWDKKVGCYRAQIRVFGKKIHLLSTPSKEEAAIWYQAFSELTYGKFARTLPVG